MIEFAPKLYNIARFGGFPPLYYAKLPPRYEKHITIALVIDMLCK